MKKTGPSKKSSSPFQAGWDQFLNALRTMRLVMRRRKRRQIALPFSAMPARLRRQKMQLEALESRLMLTVNVGVARPDLVNAPYLLDQYLDTQPLTGGRDANPEISFEYGFSSGHASAGTTGNDWALAGDFSGIGFDQVVVARGLAGGALQWLGDTDRDTDQEYLFRFGLNDMTPLIADMNGDGIDDAVVVDTTTTSNLLEWYVLTEYRVPARSLRMM